jgi:predicted ATP-dependent endonuclease of OLD family
MKIEKIRIQNFKCISDSGEVRVDDNIVCLIGRNEESFNLEHIYDEEDISSYSNVKEKWDSGEIEAEDIEMVTTWFEIVDDDKEKLKEIHEDLGKIKHLKVTKYFNNQHTVESPELDIEKLKIEQTIESIPEKIKKEIDILSEQIDAHIQSHAPYFSSKAQYDQYVEEFISIDFMGLQEDGIIEVFDTFYNNLKELSNTDQPIVNDIENTIKRIEEIKGELIEMPRVNVHKILKLMPSFIYFDDINILKEDTVNIDDFLRNKSKYKTFDNLLKLVRLNAEELKKKPPSQQRVYTKEASKKITGEINEFWKQGEYEVEITYNTPDFVIMIEDETSAEPTPPSKRSKGFQWFLSFYINFMEGSKGELRNTVLLLDDTGVHLHAEGQKKLLSTLEKLKENNQIIYATHSPFLIDKNHLDRIKILEKEKDKGTIVKEKFHDSELDALAPIRAAIGATIGDSLFTNKKNIIVEGFSDYLILEAVSNYSERNKKECLDFSKTAIIPVGGADKYPYFALLLKKENFRFVTVLDYDTKGIRVKKELKERYNIKEDIVIMLNECVSNGMKGGGRGRHIEIEDLIDEMFYNRAVNEAYSKIIKKDINLDELDTTITKHTKKYIKFFKNNGFGNFDKVLVAGQINKMTLDSSFKDDDLGTLTTENFERLFKIINERLA